MSTISYTEFTSFVILVVIIVLIVICWKVFRFENERPPFNLIEPLKPELKRIADQLEFINLELNALKSAKPGGGDVIASKIEGIRESTELLYGRLEALLQEHTRGLPAVGNKMDELSSIIGDMEENMEGDMELSHQSVPEPMEGVIPKWAETRTLFEHQYSDLSRKIQNLDTQIPVLGEKLASIEAYIQQKKTAPPEAAKPPKSLPDGKSQAKEDDVKKMEQDLDDYLDKYSDNP